MFWNTAHVERCLVGYDGQVRARLFWYESRESSLQEYSRSVECTLGSGSKPFKAKCHVMYILRILNGGRGRHAQTQVRSGYTYFQIHELLPYLHTAR